MSELASRSLLISSVSKFLDPSRDLDLLCRELGIHDVTFSFQNLLLFTSYFHALVQLSWRELSDSRREFIQCFKSSYGLICYLKILIMNNVRTK